jgi:hypothetical protein
MPITPESLALLSQGHSEAERHDVIAKRLRASARRRISLAQKLRGAALWTPPQWVPAVYSSAVTAAGVGAAWLLWRQVQAPNTMQLAGLFGWGAFVLALEGVRRRGSGSEA